MFEFVRKHTRIMQFVLLLLINSLQAWVRQRGGRGV